MPETNTTKNITKEMIAAIVSESFRQKRERDKMIDAIIAEAYRKKRERDKIIDAIIAEAFGKKKPVADDAEFEKTINREDNGQFAEQSGGGSASGEKENKSKNNEQQNLSKKEQRNQNRAEALERIKKEVSPEVRAKMEKVKLDPSKDNILPELNEDTLEELEIDPLPIRVKKDIIARNKEHHSEIGEEETNLILASALYAPEQKAKAKGGGYIHFTKKIGDDDNTLVMVDFERNEGYYDAVHYFFVNDRRHKKIMGE